MNFASITNMKSNRSFEYKFKDAEGNEQSEKIEITFRTHFQTGLFMNAFQKFEQTQDCSILAEQLSEHLLSWNLDWNGEPFPPNCENLANKCTFDLVFAIVNSMFADTAEIVEETKKVNEKTTKKISNKAN